jgi:4,5-dihydroxyphthalate decarboxylase
LYEVIRSDSWRHGGGSGEQEVTRVSVPVPLTLATGTYDHLADLRTGDVRVEGVELTYLNLPILEIFHRFIRYREWDASEMSMAKYCSLVSQGDDSLTAIPVFPSRMHRHGSIWVRGEDGPADPSELSGRGIGVPEWAQTAGVYARGILTHEYDLPLESVRWYQASAYRPGRAEKVDLKLPAGVELTVVSDRTLEQMLLDKTIDAIISSEPPKGFLDGSGAVRRLFPDPKPLEKAFWEKTGVYPIMHVICLTRSAFEKNPWIAMNLLEACEQGKKSALHRLRTLRASSYPLPWAMYAAEEAAALFPDGDYWPYGIEGNRTNLETFLQYTLEQGVTHRQLTPEELFPEEVQTRTIV